MSRAADGTYSLPAGTLVVSGDTLLVSQHNPAMQDIEQAMTGSLSRTGQGGMQANLPMGGNRIINVADAVAETDAQTLGQSRSVSPYLDSWGFLQSSASLDQTAALTAFLAEALNRGKIARLYGDIRVTAHTIFSSVSIKGVGCRIHYDGPAGPALTNEAGVFHFMTHNTGLIADGPYDFQFFGDNTVLNVAAARHNGRVGPVSKNIRCTNLNVIFCIAGTPGT